MAGITGVKYLSIDKGYGYICRVQKGGKSFVVWTGNDEDTGMKVAKKVQDLMSKGFATFLDWYDYDMEEWLDDHTGRRNGKNVTTKHKDES